MTIDPVSLVLIGLCVVIAYLIWDKMRMDVQIDHMIEQHNNLCKLVGEFVEHVEQEFERVEEQQND